MSKHSLGRKSIGIWTPHLAFGASLFRRLGEIQGFYDSPAAFRFTCSRSLWFFGVDGVGGDEEPVVIIQQFQPAPVAKLVNLSKTGSTFSHAGWMAGTEYRSYSRDTGPIRSKRQDVDADSAQGLRLWP